MCSDTEDADIDVYLLVLDKYYDTSDWSSKNKKNKSVSERVMLLRDLAHRWENNYDIHTEGLFMLINSAAWNNPGAWLEFLNDCNNL